MSFSIEVKQELIKCLKSSRHCNIAELLAIINLCGSFKYNNNNVIIKIQTENVLVAKRCFFLLKHIFNTKCELILRKNSQLKSNNIYIIIIDNYEQTYKIIMSSGLYDLDNKLIKKRINPLVVSSPCCKRAYIRGAFLCSGSLCNPEKTYHMEFVNSSLEHAQQLKNIINSFDIDSKIIQRKGYYVIYIKEGEQIVDILNIISAHKSLMNLENVRIIKDVRNNVNRIVNCETANLNKVVSASVKHRQEIEYIKNRVGLDYLPKQLEEIANVRMMYPDLSLKELGEMLNPPVGKSGVNHRLKKISIIAENLREDFVL